MTSSLVSKNIDSQTAIYTLQMRAKASSDPIWSPYFQDKWAVQFSGGKTDVLDTFDPQGKTYPSIIARSIFFDEFIRTQVSRLHIRQIVILAAGYDTRSERLRSSIPRNVTFFEVDIPTTSRRKRSFVEAYNYPTDNVRYIEADLSKGFPDTQLQKSGCDPRLPTLFCIEGLTMYISEEEVFSLLFNIHNFSKGVAVTCFDYFFGKVRSIHPNEPFIWYSKDPSHLCLKAGFYPQLYPVSTILKKVLHKDFPTASSILGGFKLSDYKKNPLTVNQPPLIRPRYFPLVAIVQYSPHPTDKKGNMRKIENFLKKVQYPDFIVLPELSLTKYDIANRKEALSFAEDLSKSFTLQWCKKLATKHRSYVFCGLVEKEEDRLYNTVVVVDRKGTLISKSRKCKLFEQEKLWATAGDSYQTFTIPEYGKIGIGICMDISTENSANKYDPSTMDFAIAMKKEKVSTIVFLSAVKFYGDRKRYPSYQQRYWNLRLQPLVGTNTLFIGVNRVSREYCGSSAIFQVGEKPSFYLSLDEKEEKAASVQILPKRKVEAPKKKEVSLIWFPNTKL